MAAANETGLSPLVTSSTEEDLKQAAISGWDTVPDLSCPEPSHPILPVTGKRNVLITCALPYVNNVPHLGSIGSVLSADVYARYCRQRKYNTLFVCGADEYGTTTEMKAQEEGVSPQDLCHRYYQIHSQIYKWFNIQFDVFGQTNTSHQTKVTQDIFWQLHQKGLIIEDTIEQLYCQYCSRFLADRYIKGTCPFCSFDEARGDQCKKCGHLINATELKSPRCKTCSNKPCIRTSNHLLLDLPKLQAPLQDWLIGSSPSHDGNRWSSNAQSITAAWIRSGIKPRCITRDLKWGTAVPLEGYTDKVFYVWFDAPIGYISITASYTDQWEKWWKNPSQVELHQFMAKDKIPLHTIIFPSTLIGTGSGYTLPTDLSCTEFLSYEDGKFSRNHSIGVYGDDAITTGIPPDLYRFYLLYIRPETKDSVFSWSDFGLKVNTELINNIGNFINRTLVFIENHFQSSVPPVMGGLTEEDLSLFVLINTEIKQYNDCMERHRLREGLRRVLTISKLGNSLMQTGQPWRLIKSNDTDRSRASTMMCIGVNIVYLIAVLLSPYTPSISKDILTQLKIEPDCIAIPDQFSPYISPGHSIGQPRPLFLKLDDTRLSLLREKYSGKHSYI